MSETAQRLRLSLMRTGPVHLITLCVGFTLIISTATCNADFQAFLRLEGVPGDSTDSAHLDWIEALAVTNRVEGAAELGRPVFREVMLAKWVDKASPALNLACANGQRFRSALLECVQPRGSRLKFYQIGLTNVLVVRIATAGQGRSREAKPAELVFLRYERIAWTYTELDATGLPKTDLGAWWDIARNVGSQSTTAYFRVSGIENYKDSVTLTWQGKAGRTYSIWSSPQVAGPYHALLDVVAKTDGPLTQIIPIRSGAQFFTVEEGP